MKKKTVFVGVSGGVDSAVSVALLKQRGLNVVGVFIRTWHPEFLECSEEEEKRDAMRICAHLGVPFLTFDFEDVYKKEVADYMISEYKLGRTPNPDVMCNKEVKFGAFLKKAVSMGADYVATGHYAQNINLQLIRGVDSSKDQTYFLWTLTKKQLSKIIFPVGHLNKSQVRKLAKKIKLPVAEKKDSQGICFLGAVDLKDFLKHYLKEKKGKVKNEKGEIVGYHDGVIFFTLGERHGFTITTKTKDSKPFYVFGKDIKKNILYVSQNKNYPNKDSCYLNLKDINWISQAPIENKIYFVQIRYRGEFLPCRITCKTPYTAKVIFKKPVLVASGQSCVVYDRDVCLGGGVVV